MESQAPRLWLLPEGDPDSITLTREQRKALWRRFEELEKVEEELKRTKEEFERYKKRHPETVGVKLGKPYALRTPTEPREVGGPPGARPGHPARLRPRPTHIDRHVALPLTECPSCHGRDLSGVQSTRTRVVEDLPAARTEVTEYTLERRYCRACHRLLESEVLGVLPHAQLGLRLMHAVVQLKIQHRVTVEQIPPLLASLYRIELSEGEVHGILEQMARAYGPTYERFREAMREAPAKYLDETPWYVDGGSGYLWVGATPTEAVYHIGPTRSHREALELLGPTPKGVLVHDRFSAYETVGSKTGLNHQACWFHLIGDAKELVEFLGAEGTEIHGVLQTVYHAAKRVVGRGTEEEVTQLTEALVGGLSKRQGSSSHGYRFVEGILAIRERLFRFVTDARVEGTNNRAERALRPLVVARKISGGSRSWRGARATAILASIIQTLRLRGQQFM
ncbi:MAG: IS66 family transposase, partial [Thermoplasmata archaeon]